jgi:hypothetical protein
MNELEKFIATIKRSPETTDFSAVISIIDQYYHYTPTRFINGSDNVIVVNNAGENEGSCKIFSFAVIHQLDEVQTLNCFGRYYREDVLNDTAGSDHANIRTFMKYGWKYIKFEGEALLKRQG